MLTAGRGSQKPVGNTPWVFGHAVQQVPTADASEEPSGAACPARCVSGRENRLWQLSAIKTRTINHPPALWAKATQPEQPPPYNRARVMYRPRRARGARPPPLGGMRNVAPLRELCPARYSPQLVTLRVYGNPFPLTFCTPVVYSRPRARAFTPDHRLAEGSACRAPTTLRAQRKTIPLSRVSLTAARMLPWRHTFPKPHASDASEGVVGCSPAGNVGDSLCTIARSVARAAAHG